MMNYAIEWLNKGARFVAVAHGDKDLQSARSRLAEAGLRQRQKRVTTNDVLREGEYIVWEM